MRWLWCLLFGHRYSRAPEWSHQCIRCGYISYPRYMAGNPVDGTPDHVDPDDHDRLLAATPPQRLVRVYLFQAVEPGLLPSERFRIIHSQQAARRFFDRVPGWRNLGEHVVQDVEPENWRS